MRQISALAFVLILALFLPVQKIFCQNQELSKEQIIQQAINAFEKKEGKIVERIIIYDVGNGKWRKNFEAIDKEMAKKFDVLTNRDYQAVYFAIKPKPGLKGRDVWVFVDKFTGEALALYAK